MFFSSRSASFQIRRPRSLADIFRHGPLRSSRARRAASTARSTSAPEPSAICVNTSPVAGLTVSNLFAPSTHFPSMSNCPGSTFTFAASILDPQCARTKGRDRQGRPSPQTLLFRLESRGPLLYIRGQAFLGVFTLEKYLLVLALHCQRRFHGNLPASLHRALDPSHGLCCLVRRTELLGILHHVFHEAIALVDVIDDSNLLRLF